MLLKPIVATDVAGTGEMIENEKTGLICKISVEDIYKAVSRLIIDKSLRESLVENLKKTDFSNSNQLSLFEGLFNN